MNQIPLFENEKVIDNILRVPKNHSLVKNKIINVDKYEFLSSNVSASIKSGNTYFRYCNNCPDMCGVTK